MSPHGYEMSDSARTTMYTRVTARFKGLVSPILRIIVFCTQSSEAELPHPGQISGTINATYWGVFDVLLSSGLSNRVYYVVAMNKKLYCDPVESILADHPTSEP